MTLLSSITQTQEIAQFTAGENISSGDLVCLSQNTGLAYWAGVYDSTANASSSVISGVSRYFRRVSPSTATLSSNVGVLSSISLTYSNIVNGGLYYNFGGDAYQYAVLSNGNIVHTWWHYNDNEHYFMITNSLLTSVVVPATKVRTVLSTVGWGGGTAASVNTQMSLCAIPSGGFALAIWSDASPYNIYFGTITNSGSAGVQTYLSTSMYTMYALKLLPNASTGFVLAYGDNANTGGVVAISPSGVFGTPDTSFKINGLSYGSPLGSNKLITLSNGNFAIINGANQNNAVYYGIFSATSSAITSVKAFSSVSSTSYGAAVDAAADSSGGFYLLTSEQSYYTQLFSINSTGTIGTRNTLSSITSGTIATNNATHYSNCKLIRNGTTLYVIFCDYISGNLRAVSVTDTGSSYTLNWSYLCNITSTANSLYGQVDAIFNATSNRLTILCSIQSGAVNYSGTISATINTTTGTLIGSVLQNTTNSYHPYIMGTINGQDGYTQSIVMFQNRYGGGVLGNIITGYDIIPIGVAVSAATTGNTVSVMCQGYTSTRLTGNLPQVINGWSGNVSTGVNGVKTLISGSTAKLYGFLPSNSNRNIS